MKESCSTRIENATARHAGSRSGRMAVSLRPPARGSSFADGLQVGGLSAADPSQRTLASTLNGVTAVSLEAGAGSPDAKEAAARALTREAVGGTVSRTPAAARTSPEPPGLDGGEPLAPDVRIDLEQRFQASLGHVRIHDGPASARVAAALRARAFTVGSHIGFAERAYVPRTPRGRELLMHEVAHVVLGHPGVNLQRDGAAPASAEAEVSFSVRGVDPQLLAELEGLAARPPRQAEQILRRALGVVTLRIEAGERRIVDLTRLRAESLGNYLIGTIGDTLGFVELPPDHWAEAQAQVGRAHHALERHQLRAALGHILAAAEATEARWNELSAYLGAADAGVDRAVMGLQGLQVAGAVAAAGLGGVGVGAIGLKGAAALALKAGVVTGYGIAQDVTAQATAAAIGVQDEIDWSGLTFDAAVGSLTGLLGGKAGHTLAMRLLQHSAFATFGQKVMAQVVSDLVSGRVQVVLNTVAREVFDDLRGRRKVSGQQLLDATFEALVDPSTIMMDLLSGHAARLMEARISSAPHSGASPSSEVHADGLVPVSDWPSVSSERTVRLRRVQDAAPRLAELKAGRSAADAAVVDAVVVAYEEGFTLGPALPGTVHADGSEYRHQSLVRETWRALFPEDAGLAQKSRVSGRMQGAHLLPGAPMKTLEALGYRYRDALATLLPTGKIGSAEDIHTTFDNHWKRWWRTRKRDSRPLGRAELLEVMSEAIERAPQLGQRTKNALFNQMKRELTLLFAKEGS